MQQFVTKLRRGILSKEKQWGDSAAKRKPLQRIMKEMQGRRMVQRMRDSTGNYVTNKRDMARLLEEYWSPIMSPTEVSEEECDRYLRSLPIPPRVQATLPPLWRPLTADLVWEALHKMRPCSSPGNDTAPAAVYQSMGPIFVPRMHAIIERSLHRGAAPEGWSTTILKYIPKSITSEMAAEQRTLALPDSSIKWLTTVFLLQVSDVFQQVTPAAQKGFLPGRQMVEHTIAAVECWNQTIDCILVAVDFAKTYDSVQHTLASPVLRYLGVLGQYVVLLVALTCSPLIIEVCREVQPDVVVHPGSEVRQRDPL